MATSKLNKEQYANIGSFAGIMLVYNSTNKDGELVQTAQHFFGADFEPADKSDNEIFRVIKNMVATMWHTIAEEKKLRADADGIRSKFRATTPAEIIICEKSGNRIKKYDLTDSVWARTSIRSPGTSRKRPAAWAATAAWISSWTIASFTACSMACRSIRTFTTLPNGRASGR